MKTFSMQRIDEYKESDAASTLKERDHKDATDLIVESKEGNDTDELYIVRRLTPLECERLQGFPDGWTDLGDWTDDNGKVHKYADTPRYKALGNSIALPFWKYLAKRICAQYERDITMGSLFAGIGGFEYVFQHCGAIPIWSSEIEPFCQAVLKQHFPEEEEDVIECDKAGKTNLD